MTLYIGQSVRWYVSAKHGEGHHYGHGEVRCIFADYGEGESYLVRTPHGKLMYVMAKELRP